MKKLFLPLFGLILLAGSKPAGYSHADTQLPFGQRAEKLVSLMTLDEKVGMLCYQCPGVERLGIPPHNFWNECLHGVARSGIATVFPQAIGMAAMWDREEMSRIGGAISDEARAKHHRYASQGKRGIYQGLTFWTPNINIFRDPRWGRGMETYGEDPYLTGELAVPFIRGLQGDDEKYLKLVATVKHFAVHSGPESTRHSFDVYPGDYDLSETYLPHFRKTVQEAEVYSVMCAYQRLRGAPCCGSMYLDDLLRNQWGFKGYIVSDCGAISDFYRTDAHHIVETSAEAAAMGVRAGTDLNCGGTYTSLAEAVAKGYITEAEIDVSVKRVVLAMLKLGMMDTEKSVEYASIPYSVVDSEANRALALDAARKSMVLLRNENKILPFGKDVRKVAVIGPNADDLDVLLGNYNGYPTSPKTPLQGIREKLPDAEVVFARGCALAEKMPRLEAIPADYFFTGKDMKERGLKALYYNNTTLQGKPVHVTTDANIDFVWGTAPPFEDMRYESFSATWTGYLVPPESGEYALGAEGFYSFEMFVDDKPLIRFRSEHHPRKEYEFLTLEAGRAYKIAVNYSQRQTEHPMMRLLWERPHGDLTAEAVEAAGDADVVVLCMGLSPLLEGEEMKVKVKGFEGSDRTGISLPDTQTALMKEIHKLGKPTVLVLLNGSAVSLEWEAENIPAIIEAWYPGQAGGAALADILFGDYNPAGRLPVTFYRNVSQLPAFDDYDMEGKTYRYFRGDPLYGFGYGLSYTDFEYKFASVPETLTAGSEFTVAVDVTNTGDMDGDEVVQLYISLPESGLRVPIRSLQGFRRVHIPAGETRRVEFTVKPDQMCGRDADNRALATPGKLQVSVGGRQPCGRALMDKNAVQKEISVI